MSLTLIWIREEKIYCFFLNWTINTFDSGEYQSKFTANHDSVVLVLKRARVAYVFLFIFSVSKQQLR